jgi:hypothetical protein
MMTAPNYLKESRPAVRVGRITRIVYSQQIYYYYHRLTGR